jgi:acyltransferase
MKKHLDYIDLAKGIGIVLVIMGHSLFPLHLAIDVFHMPLFFFISGITFSFKNDENISKVLLRKIERIFNTVVLFFFFIRNL